MKKVFLIIALIIPTYAYPQNYFCKASQSVGIKYDIETNNSVPVPYVVNDMFYLIPLNSMEKKPWLNKYINMLKPDANYVIIGWKNTDTGYQPDYNGLEYLCKIPYENANSCHSLVGIENPKYEIRFSHDLTKFTAVNWSDYNSTADNPEKQYMNFIQPLISIGECHRISN